MPVTPASGPRHGARAPLGWVPLLAAACAAAVFQGSLSYFFGQDDFLGLARARHLAPALAGPWRWLSGQGYFEWMRPFGVASAVPYHAVSLIAHAATTALLAFLLQRRFAPSAALCGALLFGTHPAIYTAVYSVSGIGEILAGLFVLGTLALATRADRWRWVALPLFGLALISKESVLLLPLALIPRSGWLAPARAAGRAAASDARRSRALSAALAAISLAVAAALFTTDVFGVRTQLATTAPYAVSLGPHVIGNFASFLGWTANFLILTTRSFMDAIDPGAFPYAAAAALLWLAGLASKRLRERGWGAGGLTFVALLVPVLGLRNHTYHYYLYVPLMGAAWCLSALLDVWLEAPLARGTRRGAETPAVRPRVAPQIAAWILGAILVVNGWLLVRKIETFPFTDPRLRADPLVDRARIARRVYQGLAAATLPPGAPLVFWSPASIRVELAAHPSADVEHHETYWERNVRAALMDGLAVRVLFPRSGEATFVHQYLPGPAGTLVALYDPDGSLRILAGSTLDSLIAAGSGVRR